MKTCPKCLVLINTYNKTTKNLGSYCDSCTRVYAKAYRKQYYALNTQKIKTDVSKTRSYYLAKIREQNPIFKEGYNVRSRIRRMLKVDRATKKLEKIIGCSKNEFKTHISSQFKSGMSWDNYGEWHLDHIKPTSSAKTREELYELFHYSNTQPLWASDNKTKGKS